jgi:cardiolipin synthase (CMP-forming)
VSLRWIPNAITLARLVAAFPLLWLLMNRHFTAALVLAVLAGISDALDGFLAKKYDWRSVVGGVLDPVADKLMVSACFVGLWFSFQIPGWFLLLVLGRDLVIVSGALAWWRVIGVFKPAPSPLSKTNTAVQLLLVAVLLANAALRPLPLWVLQGLLLASAIMTVVSGLDYLWRYGSRAVRALRSKQ